MKSNYKRLGDYIHKVDERNDQYNTNLQGLSMTKEYRSSTSNIVGTDLSNYKVMRKNRFVCDFMSVIRVYKLPVVLHKNEEIAIVSPAYTTFEINDITTLLPEYLMLWFRRPEFDRYSFFKCDSAIRGGFDWEALCDCLLPVPPIEEQEKIVDAYQKIEDRIALKRKINHNLEQQASELFDAWFISLVQSDGKMPADWHKGTLGDISAITSGKRPPMKQAVASVDATIPLVGAASIMGFTNAILYNEPILVTGRVGTHGVAQRFQSPCWTSDNTLVIKSDFYEYTFQVLQRVDYVNMNRGSTQPLITQTDLKNVSIVIPTEEVLLEYEKIAGSLMAMYESNRKENECLATLRDTLLPKLMSGEIDVSEVEI